MQIKISFIQVEDKPGYYYLDKYTIISEETLKKAINEYNDKNKNQLFLSDSEFYTKSYTCVNLPQ